MSQTFKSDPSMQDLIKFCKEKYSNFIEYNCFEEINTDLINKVFLANKKIKELKP